MGYSIRALRLKVPCCEKSQSRLSQKRPGQYFFAIVKNSYLGHVERYLRGHFRRQKRKCFFFPEGHSLQIQ
jgi:hypothetical protein